MIFILLLLGLAEALQMAVDRPMPPGLEDRLRKGLLTAGDVTRAFTPSSREVDALSRTKFEGSIGTIFSLEGVLVDMKLAYSYALSILAEDLRRDVPSSAQAYDVIGLPFGEALTLLQWNVPRESVAAVEARFQTILLKLLEALPLTASEGALGLLDELIRGGNKLTINTQLSRDLAIKAISKSGISDSLEGRLGAEALVFPSPEFPGTYRGQQLLRCCAVMRKPPTLVVSLDANSRSLLDAKRDGFSTVAVKGTLVCQTN